MARRQPATLPLILPRTSSVLELPGGGHQAELLHQAQHVGIVPQFDDLILGPVIEHATRYLDFLAGRWDAQGGCDPRVKRLPAVRGNVGCNPG